MVTSRPIFPLNPDHRRKAWAGSITDNHLLFYSPSEQDCEALVSKCRAAGWEVFSCDNPLQARNLADHHAVPAGILLIESNPPDRVLEDVYATLSSAEEVVWLALLSDRGRMNDELCNLVATCCMDFFTPPHDCERILATVGHAAGLSRIRHRSLQYRCRPESFHGMVGQSLPMRRLFRQLRKVARSEAPVVLYGESGVGKQLAANAIHQLSARASAPVTTVNCASVPATRLHEKLLGDKRGVFRGVNRRRVDRFEAAQGGVLFLREICELPLDQQAVLLRVLEDGRLEPRGENKVAFDVRVIVSSRSDLAEAVAAGQLREDLYHLLDVLRVDIPPLRERGTDIELLANHVLEKYAGECELKQILGFDKQALAAMSTHIWQGNVRELLNRVRGAIVMSEGNVVTAGDLGLEDTHPAPSGHTLEFNRAECDRRSIEAALLHNRHNMSQAARELGISRTTLYRMMDKLALKA